jgi:hypothetical protein
VEALICADTGLADLDRTLGESYHALLATRVGEAQMLLREEQRAWAEGRAASCGVESDPVEEDDAIGCLIALYRARIAELQPGQAAKAPPPSGYGWLMGDWNVAAAIHGAERSQASDAGAGRSSAVSCFSRRTNFDLGRRQLFLSALQCRAGRQAAIRRSQRLSRCGDGAGIRGRGSCLVGCSALD